MEYEYSFKVSSLKEYIKFCQTNNFKLLSTSKQTRTIYTKEKVKFELDEYELPEAYYVVGIEGTKQETDLVYQLLKDINKKYKVQ